MSRYNGVKSYNNVRFPRINPNIIIKITDNKTIFPKGMYFYSHL